MPAVTAVEPRPRTSRWRAVSGAVTLVVVAVFLAIAVTQNWAAVSQDLGQLSVTDWALSVFWGVVALVGSCAIWATVLRGMGGHLGLHDAVTVFFTGQLGKYVPGSIWPAIIQTRMGARHGIATRTMIGSYGYALAVSVSAGGVLGLCALVSVRSTAALWASGGVALLALFGFLVLLHPRGAERAFAWLADRTGRQLTLDAPSREQKALAVLLSFLTWIAFGLHAWIIASALGADAGDVLVVIGGFALAFVAGVLFLPVPGGAGVREGVLVLTIGVVIGRPGALTLALISRFMLLVLDVVLAVLAGAIPLIRMARRWERDGVAPDGPSDAVVGLDEPTIGPGVDAPGAGRP